jgi:hypothetical protein
MNPRVKHASVFMKSTSMKGSTSFLQELPQARYMGSGANSRWSLGADGLPTSERLAHACGRPGWVSRGLGSGFRVRLPLAALPLWRSGPDFGPRHSVFVSRRTDSRNL